MVQRHNIQITSDNEIVDEFSMYDLVIAYIDELNIDPDDISDVQLSLVDIPGHVWSEINVASSSHPTGGSICVSAFNNGEYAGQVQVIHYHDRNPQQTHFRGQPHWNQEVRIVYPNGEERLMRGRNVRVIQHQLADSPTIEVRLLDEDDIPIYSISRDDFRDR